MKNRIHLKRVPHLKWLYLLIIFGVALLIRWWGIRFGLPYSYHYDEQFYVTGALNLGAGVIVPPINPPAYMNFLAGEYGFYYLIGRLLHQFTSAASFESFYRTDPTNFYFLSRITSAVLGSMTVLVVYGLGRQILNHRVGLIASILLAFSFLHVRDSHYGVPDISVAFLVGLTVLISIRAIDKKSLIMLLLSAAVGGLAVSAKWSTWPIAFSIGLGALYLAKGTGSRRVLNFLGVATLTGIVFLASFLISGFQLFLSPKAYFDYARLEITVGAQGGFSLWQVDTLPGWLFYLKTFTWGIGWMMLLFSIIGLVVLIVNIVRSRETRGILFLSFPVSYYLYMGSTQHYFARYSIPLIPFFVLFAAYSIVWIAGYLFKDRPRAALGSLIGMTILLLLQPAVSSLRHDWLLTQADTRTLAKEWIEQNLPAGAKIAIDDRVLTPPLATTDLPVPFAQKIYEVVVPNYRGLDDGLPAATFREQGFDYLISSSFKTNIPLLDSQRQRKREEFYDSLEKEYKLIKVFWPNAEETDPPFIFDEFYGPAISLWQRERPGPVIKIYAVNPDAR